MNKQCKLSSMTVAICLAVCVLLRLALPAACFAQRDEYRIGATDVLSLKVYAGGEQQIDMELTVSVQGTISVPMVGQVMALDRTVPQLEESIRIPLEKDYFVDPQVHIVITEYHSIHYYISGAVKNPGSYESTSRLSLMELIAKAGGALPERGNVAYLLRSAATEVEASTDMNTLVSAKDPDKIDLRRLLDQGDLNNDVVLEAGDVVYIPFQKSLSLASSKIYVDGQVASPGVYDYQPGLTALNACVMAGGFDKFAAPHRASIIRVENGEQRVIKINLVAVREGKLIDPELEPGDRIHVPETWF
ncbi:polysaccharide export outer membrane protein [Desulfatibacillum alkenivorans DSM 16219]|uniref:Polysaccharide export outer membrane protein n=2 Tax=Desulfatibacillum alkenivorans TaxID=259354 RepID=A0A1M6UD11_9BACT|nr:polysaccharide export outer membrane protein [Desulfatibacillum alkenivorans DSM 16219]